MISFGADIYFFKYYRRIYEATKVGVALKSNPPPPPTPPMQTSGSRPAEYDCEGKPTYCQSEWDERDREEEDSPKSTVRQAGDYHPLLDRIQR